MAKLPPPNDADTEAFVIKDIVRLIKEAKGDVIVLIDACTIRHYVRSEVDELLRKTHFPVYSGTLPLASSLIAN